MPDQDVQTEVFGCARCWPAGADEAWRVRAELAIVTDLVDESHYGVTILACPQCTQRFVQVYAETIDWAGGDDPQCTNFLPITEAEAADLERQRGALTETALSAIGPRRRCLLHRYPADSDGRQNFWRAGISVGPHD